MIRVGLTGGIGSGKTTVARVFRTLGIPVFETDAEGRRVLSEEAAVINAVTARFGTQLLLDRGIDRAALAGIVFQDAAALNDLNAIIHPAVRAGFNAWAKIQEAPYVIMESAIMVESGSSRIMDRIIVVSAPEALRIKRVVDRDGVEESAVRSRMANQISEAERLAVATHAIHNDDRQLVTPQVLAVHEALLNFATA